MKGAVGIMRKADLVAAVANKARMAHKDTDTVIAAMLEVIIDTVAAGDKVTLTGFGSFEKRERAARQGRNPQTGATIQIPATSAPAFSPGKGFKDAVSGNIH